MTAKPNPLPALPLVAGLAAAVFAWEGAWWLHRRLRRASVYQMALAYARAEGRPLVVMGAPDGGATAGYGCGDVTVDLAGSAVCPNILKADITKPLPFADDSVVVFVSCVLEYVHDVNAAIAEIQRISGGHAFYVGVPPYTLTAYLYPGAKRTLPSAMR
jgi:SAM-dependent methyltransferase